MDLLISESAKPYTCINDLRDIKVSESALKRLADADAFRSIGLDRRQALWEVSTKDCPHTMFAGQAAPDAKGEEVSLPVMAISEHVVHDYAATSQSLKAHL